MKLAVQIDNYTWPDGAGRVGTTLAEIAAAADRLGFAAISVVDHLFQAAYVGDVTDPMLECYATLAFIAAHTSQARLMAVMTAATYRHPGLLAKTVTTLDVLSGGRAGLGIGAGWYEDEARGLGLPFPPLRDRFALLEETLQVCLQMWQGDERPYQGQRLQLERPLCAPQALTRPHPPIMVGGAGERRTLRLVARYADACNLYPTPDLPHKLDVLRAHCAAEGRAYDAIEKTCMVLSVDVGQDGSRAGEVIERLRRLASLGIQTAICSVKDIYRIKPLEVLGREVLPAIAAL